jgi:hypothetical protein
MPAVETVADAGLNDRYPFEPAHTSVYGTPRNQNVKPSGIGPDEASFTSISGTRVAPERGVNAPALAVKT